MKERTQVYTINLLLNLKYFLIFNNVVRCIKENRKIIEEGKLRCVELKQYLVERKGGFDVWLCEDASGIISKVQYDYTSNQLIGIVLPIDATTGCPKVYPSTTRDADEIKTYMKCAKSTLVYFVMAVPLNETIAPFILQLYGTDNKFNKMDVNKRWNFTIDQLKK